MIYNQLSEYLLKHLAQVQTLMMMSASSEDAGFRSITRKLSKFIHLHRIQSKLLIKKTRCESIENLKKKTNNVGHRVYQKC